MTASPSIEELKTLVTHLAGLTVPFLPEVEGRARELAEMAAALRSRLRHDAERRATPRFVLIVGPSGAGKSTIFNTLLERDASRVSSVERPSTRGGIIAGLNASERNDPLLFPTFAKQSSDSDRESGRESTMTYLRSPGAVDTDLVLVDAPDYDTHVLANREVTFRILPWADRLVLVTSTERYADASVRDLLVQINDLRIPTLFVLNKVDPTDGDRLREDYTGKLRGLGITSPEVVSLHRCTSSEVSDEPTMGRVRQFVKEHSGESRAAALTNVLAVRLSEEILAPLQRDLHTRRALGESILATDVEPASFHPAERLRNLGRIEEEGRFFLRYSHRTVFRRIAGWVRNPARLFTTIRPVLLPSLDEVIGSVADQGMTGIERDRVRVREILQATPEGRRLLSDPGAETELDDAEIREAFRPLGSDIHAWAQEMIETLTEARGRSSGPLGRLGSLFGGLLLDLVVVALSMAIVPPLLHELLRGLGLPAFTSDVERKLDEFRTRFQTELEAARQLQRHRYAQALLSLPPGAETVAAISRASRFLDRLIASEGNR